MIFVFTEKKEENILFFLILRRERESFHIERKCLFMEREQKKYIFFSSDNFWTILKLLETVTLFSIYWVRSGQSTWAPKPNSNFTCKVLHVVMV